MGEVISSIYDVRDAANAPRADGMAFSTYAVMVGEVRRVIYPEDRDSLSKTLIEYDVLAQVRENGTAGTVLFQNCPLVNPLGGLADKAVWTLRVDPKTAAATSNQRGPVDGVGSKVWLVCLNGERAAAFVCGGLRDTKDTDLGRRTKGHHLEVVFNGVAFTVGDDGAVRLTMGGKTAADGQPAATADTAGAGTYVEIAANGNWKVATKDDAQSVVLDHKAGTLRLDSKKRLTMTADRIDLGDGADQHAVLGDELVDVLGQILDAVGTITHQNAAGTTTPPLNAPVFRALKARLKKTLSEFVFVKRKKR